jgi:hypothetical protein
MAGAFPESRVVRMWQDCLPGRTDLVTEDGGLVRIIYPGRLNDDRGADLCDAVIATAGGIRKGDIEIHVKSSSWWGHRHHQNPLFNRVVLHVVYWHDAALPVTLENGHKVPTLALAKYLEIPGGPGRGVSPGMPCRALAERRGDDFTGSILDAAGDRRFASRVADFKTALLHEDAGQVLYQGIMVALGYTKNKLPMMDLAQRMPLARLEAAAAGAVPPVECLLRYQALLMGAAGLLPSQQAGRYRKEYPADEWVDRLEEIWAASGETATMSPGDWHSFKVRPGSLPRRRLAAMSYLLRRCRGEELLPAFVREMENAPRDRCLEEWLLVGVEGYWEKNLDSGLPARRSVPALLGADRAGIIVINVLLPFAVALGRAVLRPGPAEKALEFYRGYPPSAENTLEKHMKRQLGISRCVVCSARRQQGIIHIYKTLCSQGKCGECPLG